MHQETRGGRREALGAAAAEVRRGLGLSGGTAEQLRGLGLVGRGGAAAVAASGSRELGAALLEHLERGGQEARVLQLLAAAEAAAAARDPAAEAAATQRAAELRARLEALLRRVPEPGGDAAAAAALEGVRAVSSVSAALGLARLDRCEGGEALAAALEELWAAGAGVREAPEEAAAWGRLRGAAERVGAAALAFVRGQAGLESGYAAVAAALRALMESALARQQQLAAARSAEAFAEDRQAVLEQRALVHRLAAQLARKKTSTENLLAQLGGGA